MTRPFLASVSLAILLAACHAQQPSPTNTAAAPAGSQTAPTGAPWGVTADMPYAQARALLIKAGFIPTPNPNNEAGNKSETYCSGAGADAALEVCDNTFQGHGQTVLVDTWQDQVGTIVVGAKEILHSTKMDAAYKAFADQQQEPDSNDAPLSPPAVVSSVTRKPEGMGDRFTTTITKIGSRLDGDPDSGTALWFADGHYVVDYKTFANIAHAHVGDTVWLTVTALPAHCPPGDTRGIGYDVSDRRTGDIWHAGDAEHTCGGA